MKASVRTASIAIFLIFSIGCSQSSTDGVVNARFQGTYPIKASCTTGMVADLVRNVGGSHVEVGTLINGDPHLFKPTSGDISSLQGSDVIFYSGLNLEGKMGHALEGLRQRKPAFAVTTGIPADRILDDDAGHHDPHVWFDVSLWSEAASYVAQTLSEFDPRHADDYRKNAETYRAQLNDLHEQSKAKLAQIPKARRVLVTAHDAFQYFGRAYDVEVRGIQGISTEAEASVKEVTELVDFLTKHQIRAVFVESTVNPRNIQSLVEGCKARGHEVRIGGELYSDAMGPPGTPEGTYVGMVRHNVDTIVNALK